MNDGDYPIPYICSRLSQFIILFFNENNYNSNIVAKL